MSEETNQIALAQADREKRLAAFSSVVAAVFLTGMKLVIGLATGSLGILSEAAHSGLDLVAALVTFLAVRVSGRPADREHNYGHGKVENLSALFETVLLLVTCVWIIYEAIQRLFFKSVHVEASIWAFVVMGVSIVIDFSRSRILARAAKKYDSQALEADALHFSTDIWSSSVVIGGLALVFIANQLKLAWLANADAIAAMGVAGIVVYVSVQLGRRTIEGLLDAVPPGLPDDVARAAKVPGVLEVRRVRVRRSGPEAFADVTLAVARQTTLEQADSIASAAEAGVRRVLPAADVVVHVDPMRADDESVPATARLLAVRNHMTAHDVHVYDVMGKRTIEMHLEVNPGLSVEEAHDQVTAFEQALGASVPHVDRIVTHIEPAQAAPSTAPVAQAGISDQARVMSALQVISRDINMDFHPHDVKVNRVDGRLLLSFHCQFDPHAPITDAHAATEQIEHELRRSLPELGEVMIHVEPAA